ncbi:hypothetical protein [Chryseobacterium vaccae]|uniref:hypothetical protein n=1 Tax=Chryseobacterium vaccae TaxID=2604424 RepID=UPI0012949CC5|nr:hypothetical protein [Chryseobacterium vaccae]
MFTHYTHFKSSLLAFLCLSVPLASQKKLQTDKTGTLLQSEYVKLKKEKGYDGIGKFDTISLNPLLIYAGTVKDNKLGVIDLYGKEILKNEYKQIRGIYNTWTGLPGYHDHFLLQNEKGWAISDYYGSPKTPFIYDHLWFEEYLPVAKRIQPEKFESRIFKDSIFKAKQGESSIYLNKKGEQIKHKESLYKLQGTTPLDNNPDIYKLSKKFSKVIPLTNTLFMVASPADKNKFGVYDLSSSKMVIPAKFSYVNYMEKAQFLVAGTDDYKKYAYDLKGNLIIKEAMHYFNDIGNDKNVAVVVHNQHNKAALFTKDLKPITDFKYNFIAASDYYAKGVVNTGDVKEQTEDLMTLDGKKINFNVDYDEIIYWVNSFEQHSEPFLFLRKKDKLAIVKEGKVISDFIYDEILPEAFVASNQPILTFEPSMSANHPNHFIYFKKDGKYGIMDNNYKIILNNIYDMITESAMTGYVHVARKSPETGNKQWGVYDVKGGKEIIPTQFSFIRNTELDFFLVAQKSKFGIYDNTGKQILPLIYSHRLSSEKNFVGLQSFYENYGEAFAYIDSFGNVTIKEGYVPKNN